MYEDRTQYYDPKIQIREVYLMITTKINKPNNGMVAAT